MTKSQIHSPKKKITVFCSSSDKVSPFYFSAIEVLAAEMAKNDLDIIYGGAKVGLMGRLADVGLKHGANVYGVVPEIFNVKGVVHESLTELHVSKNMLDRKLKLIEDADGFIVFPGGIGTLDEAFEVLSFQQIGVMDKPIVFANHLDFFNPIYDFLEELKLKNMVSQRLDSLYKSIEDPVEIVKYLKNSL